MQCPNNELCTLKFDPEVNDNGDPSTPYYESYTIWFYNSVESVHEFPCTGLTEDQIEKLEIAFNEKPYEYESEPFLGLD
jgi:hypothetical protein